MRQIHNLKVNLDALFKGLTHHRIAKFPTLTHQSMKKVIRIQAASTTFDHRSKQQLKQSRVNHVPRSKNAFIGAHRPNLLSALKPVYRSTNGPNGRTPLRRHRQIVRSLHQIEQIFPSIVLQVNKTRSSTHAYRSILNRVTGNMPEDSLQQLLRIQLVTTQLDIHTNRIPIHIHRKNVRQWSLLDRPGDEKPSCRNGLTHSTDRPPRRHNQPPVSLSDNPPVNEAASRDYRSGRSHASTTCVTSCVSGIIHKQ